ncbi:MAG: RNA methyltransferase [Syntrophobacterales bacterium]|nr:RNA methyltransferase [Syntrophobacterales bacterium]
MNNVSIAVIHYPVYDKNGAIVATSVTNLEIHDIARTCMTFDIGLCYIVTPLAKQREIVGKLVDHWLNGYGATYNPGRSEALKKVRVVSDFNSMVHDIKSDPLIVGTSSRERQGKTISPDELFLRMETGDRPVLILFGTGWGLSEEVVDRCDKMLMPIKGKGNYNHLSLRVAIGIILDRIFGERGGWDERDN